jgi:hypothetical protein
VRQQYGRHRLGQQHAQPVTQLVAGPRLPVVPDRRQGIPDRGPHNCPGGKLCMRWAATKSGDVDDQQPVVAKNGDSHRTGPSDQFTQVSWIVC